MITKRKLKEKETESLLIAAQNNTTRLNYIKTKIDNTKNSKCCLFGERDETVNYIIREWSKLTRKEYKSKHDCVGKVIHWELYKQLKIIYAKTRIFPK